MTNPLRQKVKASYQFLRLYYNEYQNMRSGFLIIATILFLTAGCDRKEGPKAEKPIKPAVISALPTINPELRLIDELVETSCVRAVHQERLC